jgi:2-polyprenyl-6-methoxyphenol hydroxylase-like FAD-dependent oxidoreductase
MPFQPTESPYSFIAMVPQDVTEKLLLEELRRKGGSVEYNTTFISAVQHDDHVSATLEQNGSQLELTAAYVVGCDGAHSAVRHLLNLPFEGAQYNDLFLLADAETNQGFPANELQLCPSEYGPVAIFPMSAIRRRIVATIEHADGDAPTLDLVQRIVRDRAPAGLEISALHWSTYFRIHHRQVAQLRVGRMFVAGDAAHIHSPFGGQGMNTGLQDAWNLAWKLQFAISGHGNDALLDSYSAERRPVIKSLIETTDLLTKAMGTPNRLAQALRDTVIPMVSRLAPFQHAFVRKLSELGVAYHGSPIVEGAGERFFDDSIRGGKGILNRFLLVVGEDAKPEASDSARHLAASFADVLELRTLPQHGITLVRPDGYVAYLTSNANSETALGEIRSLIERQVAPSHRQKVA